MPLALEAMHDRARGRPHHQPDDGLGRGARLRSRPATCWRGWSRSCAACGSIPKRMRANLDLGGGLIMAEAVMLELGTDDRPAARARRRLRRGAGRLCRGQVVRRPAGRRPARHGASRRRGDRQAARPDRLYRAVRRDGARRGGAGAQRRRRTAKRGGALIAGQCCPIAAELERFSLEFRTRLACG